ncbi:reticulocalbin-3-like isoform X2 [Poecile atricapillus]|uniref:reticulocalbin-3-like isoform X2 n=1 Tax=Poecile atricapillus TaxID=48891 RepID=UPI0027381FDF|nr:reticulocalbin-3-like isoform X2 [Poecile atricapillus]
MLPAWLWPLWPLLALTSGGSPQAPQPHFGDPPQPHSHDSEGLFWDHAAIWGAKEAQEQRELPPEESRRRLGLLVDLMDSDSSGGVSGEELRAWILRRHRGSREESLRIERSRLDLDGDGAVGWDELHRESFGDGEDFGGSHRRLLLRSRLRFQAADADGDRRLRGEELEAFLHPEDFQHLLHLVAQETIEDLDQNGDGLIQVDEYIGRVPEPGGDFGALGAFRGEPSHGLRAGPAQGPRRALTFPKHSQKFPKHSQKFPKYPKNIPKISRKYSQKIPSCLEKIWDFWGKIWRKK